LQADPLASIDVVVQCPSCTNRWCEVLDVIGMLWAELSAASQRLLAEVAQLAMSFGWSEQEVLALPDSRRQKYLELLSVQGGS
jgi:hypothetical protein